jgi:hemerythrin-like metal-binding protein
MNEEARSDDDPFDAHHQLQAAMIDAYEAALLDGTSSRLAADTLGHLVDFTAVHFLEEERFMVARAYPHLQPHRAAHTTLLERIRALETEAGVAETRVALAGVPRLRRWLEEHVQGFDRELATWSAAQPRQPSQTT